MKFALRFVLPLLLSIPALAAAEGVNLSGRAGTLGIGTEVGYAFNDYVNLRVALNNYSYEYDTTEDDINYNFDLELESTAILLDIHPFAGTFRITAGMLDNKNRLEGQAEPAGTYDIAGETYAGADVGTLFSTVQMGEDQPLYLGLGWSKSLGDSGFGLGFDVGMVMMGDSNVELNATGPILDNPTLRDQFLGDLADEEIEVETEINEDFDTYPVISLGLTYQF